jgi:hypothetical protein
MIFLASSATAVEMAPLAQLERAFRSALQTLLIAWSSALVLAASAYGQTLQHATTSNQRSTSSISAPASHSSSLSALPSAPLAREFTLRDFARQRADQESTTDTLKTLKSSLFRTTKTPFMTESRVPLTHLAGSRLGLNFDITSTSNRNVMMGPLIPAQMTEREFAQGRTDDRYGISLSVPLGRAGDAGASRGLFGGVARAFRQRK